MKDFKKNLIHYDKSMKEALIKINNISEYFLQEPLALFVINDKGKLVGTFTDGDIRRCLVNGNSLADPVKKVMNSDYHYLRKDSFSLEQLDKFNAMNIKLIPVLDENDHIVKIIDLTKKRSLIPVDAVIMAGGEGKRLRPFTSGTPKPMLKIGEKPIIEYNIDRINVYGIDNLVITVNYLADQLTQYFGDGSQKGMNIRYIREKTPLGTIGSLGLVKKFYNDHVLLMNSDLLTTIDLHSFYKDFINKKADMAVASIPYEVKVPYAILDINGECIKSFKEKPEYNYYSNAGIYLLKKELINSIPKNEYLDATEFMEQLLSEGKKISYFPILGYWLDIGKQEDFEKAQKDIKILDL